MGYNQWLFIAFSFHQTFGLQLMVNGLEVMSVLSPTVRVNPPYPGYTQERVMYMGRGTHDMGVRDAIIMDGLVIQDVIMTPKDAFSIYSKPIVAYKFPALDRSEKK